MSNQINIENNSNETIGWSEVRSKKMIQKTRTELKQSSNDLRSASPFNFSLISPSPSNLQNYTAPNTPINVPTSPVNVPVVPDNINSVPQINIPVSASQINVPITNSVPITHNSAFSNPNPVYPNQNFTSNDIWTTWLYITELQHQSTGKMLENIKHELKFPVSLRGKPENVRKNEIYNNLVPNIKNILTDLETHSEDDRKEIINMIYKTQTSLELFGLTDPTSLRNKVIEVRDIFWEGKDKSDKVLPSQTKTSFNGTSQNCPDTIEEVSGESDNENTKNNDNIDENKQYKYTLDENIIYKKSLVEAQEKFFEECILNEKEIDEIKNNLQTFNDAKIEIKKVNVVDDDIVIGNHKFSKSHYLSNPFFQKRLKKKYESIFYPQIKKINIVLPNKNRQELKICGYKEDN